jgi:hypothetical protein
VALTERQPAALVPAAWALRLGSSLKSRVCAQGPLHAKLRCWSCDFGALSRMLHLHLAQILIRQIARRDVRTSKCPKHAIGAADGVRGCTGKVPSRASLVSVSAPTLSTRPALHTNAHGPGSAQRISSNAVSTLASASGAVDCRIGCIWFATPRCSLCSGQSQGFVPRVCGWRDS